MFPVVTGHYKTNPVLPKGWRKTWELFGSLQEHDPNKGQWKLVEGNQRRKPKKETKLFLLLMLSQHWWINGAPWRRVAVGMSPRPLPAFPLSLLSYRVKTPRWKELCSFLRVQAVLSSPPPEELWFITKATPTQQRSANFPQPQQFPGMGTLWWHIKITWSIWDLRCFSKLAHLFYSKLRLNLILVQELPPQQTVLKIASILQGSLSGLSVSLLATEFSVP